MIRAIIFDCFGVLTSDMWKEFVYSVPEEQREPLRELNRAHDSRKMTLQEFTKAVFEMTGREPKIIEALIDPEREKNTLLMEMIAELKRTYKIGLLSNVGSNWIRDRFLDESEQNLFDSYILSYEVGVVKPSPLIYKLAAEKLGVDTNECVFVDDGEQNCIGARNVGMQAILYENFVQFKNDLNETLVSDSDNNS